MKSVESFGIGFGIAIGRRSEHSGLDFCFVHLLRHLRYASSISTDFQFCNWQFAGPFSQPRVL